MAAYRTTYQKSTKFFFNIFIMLLFFTSLITPQVVKEEGIVLEDYALKNYRQNLSSEYHDIVKSSIYFAGKYRIMSLCPELLTILKNSNDEELCKLAVWSLYEIGEEEYCNELQRILDNRPSEKIKDHCKFLGAIREYGNALLVDKG
jgi:hypothetical protein